MAHELGHLLLHRVETITLAREDGDIPPYKDPEWQANAFAGELLAPYEYIKDMSIIDHGRLHRSRCIWPNDFG